MRMYILYPMIMWFWPKS